MRIGHVLLVRLGLEGRKHSGKVRLLLSQTPPPRPLTSDLPHLFQLLLLAEDKLFQTGGILVNGGKWKLFKQLNPLIEKVMHRCNKRHNDW